MLSIYLSKRIEVIDFKQFSACLSHVIVDFIERW